MSYGALNENMIFPIVELIRQEINNAMTGLTPAVHATAGSSQVSQVQAAPVSNNKPVSGDCDITIQKQDPAFPGKISGVLIVYKSGMVETVTILRNADGRIATVKYTLGTQNTSPDDVYNDTVLTQVVVSLNYTPDSPPSFTVRNTVVNGKPVGGEQK